MAQQSRGSPVRSPVVPGTIRPAAAAAQRLLSLDVLLAVLALTGGLRVIYLAATAPALPGEAGTIAHAYAVGHLTSFTDAGGAGVSRFGWLQLAAYTMMSDAFGRETTAVAAVRETMLVAAAIGTVLLWLLARRTGLTRWAAALAVVLMAVSPLAIGLQRLVVVEHLAAVWGLAGFVLLTTPKAKVWHDVLAALCLLAAILTSPLALFLLPAAGWLLVRRSLARAALVAVLVNLGLGVAFGPFAAELRPQLAASGAPHVFAWVTLDPALAVFGCTALVAAVSIETLRPFAVGALLLAAALLIPALPATAALALLAPFVPLLVAGTVQAVALRRRPEHMWLPARPRTGITVTAVALVAALAASWIHGFLVLRPQSGDSLADARNWLRANASGARLLVDDASWSELAAAGWPTGLLAPPATCAKQCPPADWAVLTGDPKSLLLRYPRLSDQVEDGSRIAVFGSGDTQVAVTRLDVPPPDPEAPSEDSARAHAGAALAESPRISLAADAATVLRAGCADPRLIATVAALAGLQDVRITGFPAVPGEDAAGQPRRQVLLAGTDLDSAEAFYTGQRDLFRPASVVRTADGVLVTYPLFPPTGLLVPFASP